MTLTTDRNITIFESGPSATKASCSFSRSPLPRHRSSVVKTWIYDIAVCMDSEVEITNKKTKTSFFREMEPDDVDEGGSREVHWQATQNACGPLQSFFSEDTRNCTLSVLCLALLHIRDGYPPFLPYLRFRRPNYLCLFHCFANVYHYFNIFSFRKLRSNKPCKLDGHFEFIDNRPSTKPNN